MKSACFFLVLPALFLVTSQLHLSEDDWAELFECRNQFDFLVKIIRMCQESQYITPLSVTRKNLDRASGELLVKQLNDYCKTTEDVLECAALDIDISYCSEDTMENFQSMMLKSNWICKPGVKEVVLAELSKLPAVSLKPSDFCYRESVKRTYSCVHRFLSGERPNTKSGMWNRVMASLPCSYRKLKKVCPAPKALLLTLLNYDSLLMPPALGINITETLVRLHNIV